MLPAVPTPVPRPGAPVGPRDNCVDVLPHFLPHGLREPRNPQQTQVFSSACGVLENRYGVFSSIEGSNPSPSVFRVRRVPRVHAPLAISLALLRP